MSEYVHYIFDVHLDSNINIKQLKYNLKLININVLCICYDNNSIKITLNKNLNSKQESKLLYLLKNYIV